MLARRYERDQTNDNDFHFGKVSKKSKKYIF